MPEGSVSVALCPEPATGATEETRGCGAAGWAGSHGTALPLRFLTSVVVTTRAR